MKFLELIEIDNLVVHCNTEDQANKLLEIANAYGLKWCNGDSYIGNNNFEKHGSGTCYYLSDGTYSSLEYFKMLYCSIIEFDDVEFDDLMLSDLNKEQTTRFIENPIS